MEYNNTFANIITDNRYLANSQLAASEFKPQDWKTYRLLCRIVVDNALAVYKNSIDFKDFDLAIVNLFALFGMEDANKGISKYRIRFALACLQMKKEYSVAYKTARKEYNEAHKALKELEAKITEEMTTETNPEEFAKVEEAQKKEDACTEKLDALAAEPKNVWWNPVKLSSTKDKELAIARKHIEDTIADIIFERSNMTDEDRRIEKAQLDGGRKAMEEIKKEQKNAQ